MKKASKKNAGKAVAKKIEVVNRTGEKLQVIDAPKKASAKKAAAKKEQPEPELGASKGIVVNGKAVAAPKKTKAEAPKELKIRLYKSGEFYFGRYVAEKLGENGFMKVAVDGKKITLTPTASEKDSYALGNCHAAKVLRVKPVLKAAGLEKFDTQDLVAAQSGNGLVVTVK